MLWTSKVIFMYFLYSPLTIKEIFNKSIFHLVRYSMHEALCRFAFKNQSSYISYIAFKILMKMEVAADNDINKIKKSLH